MGHDKTLSKVNLRKNDSNLWDVRLVTLLQWASFFSLILLPIFCFTMDSIILLFINTGNLFDPSWSCDKRPKCLWNEDKTKYSPNKTNPRVTRERTIFAKLLPRVPLKDNCIENSCRSHKSQSYIPCDLRKIKSKMHICVKDKFCSQLLFLNR